MTTLSQRGLLAVLCTLSVLVAVASAQQCTTNQDGTIIWGSLPPLRPTSPQIPDYQNDGQRRITLSDMARGFVNMVTPPHTVSSLIDYTAEILREVYMYGGGYRPEIWPMFQELAAILVGVIVCLSVGVAYVLLVLSVGPIFGCCRCCNKCGGKRVQEPSGCPGCMRVFLTVFLLCITAVLCAGMAMTNFSNDFINYAYTTSESSSKAVVTDVQWFTSDSLKQMEYVTDDEFGIVDCLIRQDLRDIGDEIADPVVAYLKTDAGVDDALDAFGGLRQDLTDVNVALASVNASRTAVMEGTAQLSTSLAAVKANLDALVCTGCPDTTNLDTVSDYSALPDVSNLMAPAVDAQTVAGGIYDDFQRVLSNISTQIDKSTGPSVSEVERLLDDTKATIDQNFARVSEMLTEFNDTLSRIRIDINRFFTTVDEFWDYSYYSLIGVTCLSLLVVLFNVIGVAMGTCAYKDVLPTERSRMSNAGGNVLIAGVVFSIIFGPILMVLCFAGFAVAGTATLACEPLKTYEIFDKTIDKPDYLVPGYYLGDLVLGNSSVDLKASSVLTECNKNAAIYRAMNLSSLFSVDSIAEELDNGKQQVMDMLKNEINIPPLDLVGDNFGTELTDAYTNMNLGSVNPTVVEGVLASNVTDEDLVNFAAQLRAAKAGNLGIAADLESAAVELERIQAEEVEPINNKKTLIISNTQQLADLNVKLPSSIASTVNATQSAESQVTMPTTGEKVQNSTTDYANKVFGYADQYVAKVDSQLNEDIGKCQTVRQTYDTGKNLVCHYIFDSLNTLWFTTGWCAIFLVLSVFVAVRLAKYYRIMDEEALPKAKRSPKGRGRRVDQDLAMSNLPEDGHHTGHDNIRLVESLGRGGMQPQQNPHYIPDDVINGYDGYNNLGRPMAPPPAYHPGQGGSSGYDRDDDGRVVSGHRSSRMPAVEADSYTYGYSQDPVQRQNRQSVMHDMQEYNKKPRPTTYL